MTAATGSARPPLVLVPAVTSEPDCLCGDPKHDRPCRRACNCQVYRPNTDGPRS